MTINTPSNVNWSDLKSKLKKEFPSLTDNDLVYEFGKKNEMLAKLQVKLGKSNEEWDKIINGM